MLKCKEASTFDRLIDYASIKAEYTTLMDARAEARLKAKNEDRQRKIEELAVIDEDGNGKSEEEQKEELDKWDEDRDAEDDAADENDPEKPNYEEMVEKFREKLRERREKDDAFMEEFGQQMKDKQIPVIDDLKTDISPNYVFLKILDRIKENFECRNDMIEKELARVLLPAQVIFYEKSHSYKHSCFGLNSPIDLAWPVKHKNNSVLYRERIYFFPNQEQ